MGGSPGDVSENPLLILQAFSHFSYVTAHSPTLPSIYLRHSLFSNPPVASPTSQLILQPFFRFSYVTGSSLTSPGDPHMSSRFQYLTSHHTANPGRLTVFFFNDVWVFVSPVHTGRLIMPLSLNVSSSDLTIES